MRSNRPDRSAGLDFHGASARFERPALAARALDAAARVSLERLQVGLVAALAATCLASIFAAQVALTLAIVIYAARLVTERTGLADLPVAGSILAFCVWSLLAASFSSDPVASHEDAKKLVLFALFYVALDSLRQRRTRERIIDGILLGGIALSLMTIVQYHFMGYDTLEMRPRGLLGHYMTASGLAIPVLIVAAARLVFARETGLPLREAVVPALAGGACVAILAASQHAGVFAEEARPIFVAVLATVAGARAVGAGGWQRPGFGTILAAVALPLSGWSLIVSQTRSAWLGALAGLGVLLLLKAPRSLWLLPAGVAALLVLQPAPLMSRLTLSDASSVDRYYMWQAGVDMVIDKPIFGHGPGMIMAVYPAYRWPGAPNPRTPHLHDNALQIAAERGLPGLGFWLWMLAVVLITALREARRSTEPDWCVRGALGALTGLLVAGLFEYNFGDSEVLMLTLLLMALPFASRRERHEARQS